MEHNTYNLRSNSSLTKVSRNWSSSPQLNTSTTNKDTSNMSGISNESTITVNTSQHDCNTESSPNCITTNQPNLTTFTVTAPLTAGRAEVVRTTDRDVTASSAPAPDSNFLQTLTSIINDFKREMISMVNENHNELKLKIKTMNENHHKSFNEIKNLRAEFSEMKRTFREEISIVRDDLRHEFKQDILILEQNMNTDYNILKQNMNDKVADVTELLEKETEQRRNDQKQLTQGFFKHQKEFELFFTSENRRIDEQIHLHLDQCKQKHEFTPHPDIDELKNTVDTYNKKLQILENKLSTSNPNHPQPVVVTYGSHTQEKTIPQFNGRAHNPQEYLRKLKKYYERNIEPNSLNNTEALQDLIESSLGSYALSWFDLIKNDVRNWSDFENAFNKKYWSREVQRGIRKTLEQGKYQPHLRLTRSEYFIDKVRLLKSLTPPLAEDEIVTCLAEHFSELIQDAKRVQNICTVVDFELLLQREDLKNNKNRTNNEVNHEPDRRNTRPTNNAYHHERDHQPHRSNNYRNNYNRHQDRNYPRHQNNSYEERIYPSREQREICTAIADNRNSRPETPKRPLN